jgi:hypothetical protein
MRNVRCFLTLGLVAAVTSPVWAVPKFYQVFKKDVVDKLEDKKFAEQIDKADVKCLVCHQGKKSKEARNSFGKEMAKLLDRKKDLKNDAKISASIQKVLAMHVDAKDPKSETYMDRLKAGKWPGGNLEDLKKEPPKSAKGAAEKKE